MVDLASYNYKHLDQDFGKVLAESTPSFKQNFTQSSEALKTAIVKYDSVGVGSGRRCGTGLRYKQPCGGHRLSQSDRREHAPEEQTYERKSRRDHTFAFGRSLAD